jgi:hypothetical protein
MAAIRPRGYEAALKHLDTVMRQSGIPSKDENAAYMALGLMALVEGIEEDMKRVHERLDVIEDRLRERRG